MKANLLWHTQRAAGMLAILNTANFQFRIFKGTMPSAATVAAGLTPTSNSSDLLLTYSSMAANAFARTSDNYQRVFLASVPSAVAASQSGTATWFSLMYTVDNGFTIVGDVSDVSGNAPLKMITTNIVSGTSYDIYSFAFQVKQ